MQSTASHASPTASPPVLRRFDQLPGPRGIPVFGNALQLDSARLHQQLEKWRLEFGPLFRLQIGKRRLLAVADHQLIAAILRDRPAGFRRTSRLEEIWLEMKLPMGVFGANGEVWQRQRPMVMAGFDPAHVKSYFPALQAVAGRLVGRWQRAASQGQAIDLQADLMRYTVDTIAGLAFGAEVNTLESDGHVIQQHLDKIFPALFRRALSPVAIWRYVHSSADRQLERSITEVNAAVAGFVQQARARMQANPSLRENPRNLLEAMVAAADEPNSGIDDDQVAGNVLTMLLAGEDTTANTLAWMIHLLWLNPGALTRAIKEVRRVVRDPENPTFDEMAHLNFVEACAHETMRLKPVAPVIPLQTLHDMTIGGVRVPAGVIIQNLMRSDSLSDSHLPRAKSFEPERWLAGADGPGAAASAIKRISMPFGAGPRICPGRYLALLEIKMAVAVLLGNFDIDNVTTPGGREAREHLSFTMQPVGLRMRLRVRDASLYAIN
jgi:cytochrome P450